MHVLDALGNPIRRAILHELGEVAFAISESFTGLLAPLIARSIPDLQPAFTTFAADLKRRAECVG